MDQDTAPPGHQYVQHLILDLAVFRTSTKNHLPLLGCPPGEEGWNWPEAAKAAGRTVPGSQLAPGALTEDGEDDHEEEQQEEYVHEGRQGLEDLPQVAREDRQVWQRQPGLGRATWELCYVAVLVWS